MWIAKPGCAATVRDPIKHASASAAPIAAAIRRHARVLSLGLKVSHSVVTVLCRHTLEHSHCGTRYHLLRRFDPGAERVRIPVPGRGRFERGRVFEVRSRPGLAVEDAEKVRPKPIGFAFADRMAERALARESGFATMPVGTSAFTAAKAQRGKKSKTRLDDCLRNAPTTHRLASSKARQQRRRGLVPVTMQPSPLVFSSLSLPEMEVVS
jgi:hypothetical protein